MKQSTWTSGRWERVTTLFEQALELPSLAREDFLSTLQREEPAMALAVRNMLATDALFATNTPPKVTDVLHDALDPILPSGSKLGSYAIDRSLGAGGMGRVYQAHRVDGDVVQTVAIKCLRFPDRDPEFMRRFLRERQILATLQHPNIARFLDTGSDEHGQPFVVLEYVDGRLITTFAAEQKLSLNARIELLLKVMDAVAYSHRQLIIHRDIKPGNRPSSRLDRCLQWRTNDLPNPCGAAMAVWCQLWPPAHGVGGISPNTVRRD
jgi:eukaryotic-like serine/threonine-protein kinase